MQTERYQSFEAFWPFYLKEHSLPLNRRLHFVGTTLALSCLVLALVQMQPLFLLGAPLCGYGWAWFGHFMIEKNRPATFQYPLWSLRGDFRMYGQMLRGQLWG